MLTNVEIIKELYACAEGRRRNMETFVSMFSEDGYLYDVSAGRKFYGKEIGESIGAFGSAFPDVHRELLNIYSTDDVVVVELAIQGTNNGELVLASGSLAPTGRSMSTPCVDVFHLKDGQIASFHCYTMVSALKQQLGVSTG